jgi:hypothetical protein
MQLVDQAGAQILANCGHAATDANVTAARRSRRLLKRGVKAFGDKVEFRTSCHLQRRARVMS